MIFTPLKEVFLQTLISLLPAFLLQVWAMKPRLSNPVFNFQLIFACCCLLSFTLSMLFTCYAVNDQYYDFRMIPLILGLLYCNSRYGIPMILMYIGVHFMFFEQDMLWDFPNDIGLYLVPMALVFGKRFRMAANTRQRIRILTYHTIVAFLVNYLNIFIREDLSFVNWWKYWLLYELGFMIICIITSYLTLLFVESIIGKLSLGERFEEVSQQVQQESQKMRQLIDATPLGVLSVDKQGNITGINDMMLRLFDVEKIHNDDLIGKPLGHVLKQYHIDYPYAQLVRSLHGEKTHPEVLQYNGKILVSTSSGIRNQETEEVVGAVAMAHDVTELQMLRSEIGNMERLSLVGQMAASITHEIRNPMAVVRGFIQLMKEKSDPSLHDYYRIVLEELDRANAIISDFLSLAQNRIVEKEKSDLHHIIQDLSPLLWADANLRGLNIDMKLGDNIPSLELNVKEIKQLILNLVRNGMEAMTGKGTLTLETQLAQDAVQMIVKDTGEGIPKEKLDKMFEPFYTTKTKGTGLGLPLCLSIVERHKGRITVESEPGLGTTFIVSFKTNIA